MPPKMPTLGSPQKRSSGGGLLVLLVLGGVGAGGYYWRHKHADVTPAQVPAAVAIAPISATSDAGAALAAAPSPAPSATPAPAQTGPRAASITLQGPLETAVTQAVGGDVGPALAQVLTRELVWWVEMPSGLRRGDKIDFVWEPVPGEEPRVDALRLTSGKYEKTFAAYRFEAGGDRFSRFYEPDGQELEHHLVAAPLDDYEQVTSLIRDGRHHKGVDFKTPEGSPVHATFTGTVVRKNWNWRLNGDCLEVEEAAAPHRHALFLHLSAIDKSIGPGSHVERGQKIAISGNTGHSFAPHLHYQLMSADERVLDPFDSQPSVRKALPAGQKAALDAQVAKWAALMSPPIAHN
jgi:murein DD-endopeptidase